MLKQAYVDRKFFKTFGNNLLDLCDGLDENRYEQIKQKGAQYSEKGEGWDSHSFWYGAKVDIRPFDAPDPTALFGYSAPDICVKTREPFLISGMFTEIASASLNDTFLTKISEIHHKHKKDYPSGTALMLGKGIAVGKNKNFYNLMGKKYLNNKKFPYSKKINFNSIRKGEIIGEHEVKFSSGKEIIKLNHEAFDRALYSEGALSAAKWLMTKKAGLYSMRDLMNFK